MAIRKPSDYFNNENNSIEETIQDNAKNSELNTFSDAYNAFKRNLSKVDVLNNFSETLGNYQDNVEKVNYLSEKIDEIDKDIKNLLTKEDLDKALISQLLFLEECIRDVQEKVKGINHKNLTQVKLDISNLSETVNIFIDEEIPRYEKLVVESETRLIDKCDVLEDELKDTLDNIKDVIDEKYISDFKSLNEEINKIKTSENIRDELDKKIVDLEVEILRNESHIESQNKNIEDIHGDVKSAIDRLNIGKIEENNFKLGEKIKYLEEVFEKFNEKELLNENIIVEPSSTDNDDPLTPLDKNFVTLDQLQNHYRLFINRIQQQLASFGGGGEVRLEFLDDVDRDSAKVNGKFLKYDSASGKWVGANASGGAGSQTLDETLELGNTSSRGMSVGVVTSTKLHIDPVGSGVTFNEDLVVVGDARVTGILSIGTSSIVLDPNAKTISGVEKLQVGETTIKNDSEGNITFVNTFNPTQTINVGIGTTASVNTTGIITASSFTGSLIGTATNATNLNNQAASYYLNYNNFSNTPTALSSFSNDVGFVTSSVVAGYATEGFVNSAVAGIVSSAPATLDTLNELAQALGDDANFSTTVTNLIGTKASLSGAAFTGIVTAPSFSGDGSSLTNIDAATLDGLDSTQFLRSDQGDITTGNITISNTQPTLVLEDTDGVDEFAVINANGTFIIRNQTDARNDFSIGGGGAINSNGILRANAGLNVTGNITVSGTVDGRDVAADGTKLDGVASNATAYGDSDVDSHLNRTQQVSQNYVLSWDGQDYAWVAQSGGGGGGISNVVEDTTPQLGGNLDLNSKDITGTGNIDITGIVTATSFVKASNSGGFLKADGTEDTNTYLTSFTETNDLSSAVTWTNVPNANITQSSVTQHQAALSITESQISDLQSYLTSYTETQTLNDVVGLGSATTQTITVGTATTGVVVRPDGTLNVSGISTFQSHVHLGDNDELRFGAGDDFKIYHDPNDARLENSNGDVKFKNTGSYFFFDEDGGETLASFINDGAVNLYHGGNKKFETTGAGVSIANGTSDTATITGPSNLVIDPAVVDDNTGIVRIKGDLFVDGTTTQINSTSLEIADFIVGIASTATTDLLADGAGIQIGPDNTFLYEHNGGTNPSLKSSENLNVATGKAYQIAETERLSADTLSLGTGTTIHSPASNVLTFGTNGSERLRITTTGLVGIGTDNPDTLLHLQSNNPILKFTDANQATDNKSWNISAGTAQILRIQAINDSGNGGGKLFDFYRTGTQVEKFLGRSGTDYWFAVDNTNERVGIGTDNPATKLEVAGTGSPTIRVKDLDGTNQFGQILANNGTFVIESRNDTSDGQIIFRGRDNTGTNEYARFDENGNLGIGTDNPTELLHLAADSQHRILLKRSGAAPSEVSFGNEGNLAVISNNTNGISFETGSTPSPVMRIKANGDVGIGTDNPQTKVQINDVYGIETESSSFTASAGVAYTANTYTASDFVNAEYTLFFQHSSGIQSQKALVMDDGSTAYSQEYGIMSSNGLLVSVGATVKSNNVELLFTPETGVTGIITYRFTRGTMI